MVREYGFNPRSKVSVEDGAVLPRKFEPFPADMYGKPLEEIDNFIYEEVSGSLIIYPITYTYLVPHHKYYTERPLNVSLRRRTDFSPLYWPRTYSCKSVVRHDHSSEQSTKGELHLYQLSGCWCIRNYDDFVPLPQETWLCEPLQAFPSKILYFIE